MQGKLYSLLSVFMVDRTTATTIAIAYATQVISMPCVM
jgi:hypothetical protein